MILIFEEDSEKKYIYIKKKKNPSPRWDFFVGRIFDML